jgi:hypothetical protein
MKGIIPLLDLRISEFAPDRDKATRTWALRQIEEQQIEEQRLEAAEASRRMDEAWAEMHLASQERVTELRLAAIKRGEVYVPPVLARPAFPSATVGVYSTGAIFSHREPATTGRPVLLPPGFKLEHLPPR